METKTSTKPISPESGAAATVPAVLTRIDPPHAMGDEVPSNANPIAAVTPPIEPSPAPEPEAEPAGEMDPVVAAIGRSPAHQPEQMQSQALQLGAYLRGKQQELDRREALMNAREAKFENELRMARLWMRERDSDEREREADFTARLHDLEEKASQLAAAEVSVDRDTAEQHIQLSQREQMLADRVTALEEREMRLQAENEAFQIAYERLEQERVEQSTARLAAEQKLAIRQLETQQLLERQWGQLEQARAAVEQRERELLRQQDALAGRRDREAWEARLAARQSELEQAETLLAAHARELDTERAELAALREKLQLQARDERREVVEWKQRERAELAERKQHLDLAEETLAKHRAAVEQLRNDAARMHRESIELRLVSEQVWLELARNVPAAELTRSLAALRQRLAEHYREANEQLAAQQAELVRLAARLDDQQRRLLEQREQTRTWIASQQQEIEAQSARLVAREQELDRQEELARQQDQRWQKERRELREQIRHLLGRLRQESELAA